MLGRNHQSKNRRPIQGGLVLRRARHINRTLAAFWAVLVLVGAGAHPAAALSFVSEAELLPDGISSWWCRSTAVYQPHHAITYQTGVSSTGQWMLSAYSQWSGLTHRTVLGSHRADDHNTPAILAPSDRPAVVFYTGHNSTNVIRYRVAERVGDLEPGPERSLVMPGVVTYVQVHRGATDDTLVLLTRAGQQWLIAVSGDWGRTWSIRPFVAFDNGNFGYLLTTQLADRSLRVCAAGHPLNTNLSAVYYAEIDARGVVRDAKGSKLGNIYTGDGLPLLGPSEMTPVYTYAAGVGVRLLDLSAAPEPEIGLARWTGDAEATYVRLTRDGAEWRAEDLSPTGRPFGYLYPTRYVGGLSFPNPTDGGEFFISREESGTWSIEQWRQEEATWNVSRVASSTTEILARPSAVFGASADLPLTWLKIARYEGYKTYAGATYAGLTVSGPGPAVPGFAIAGDWDGDGRAEPGVFADGIWTLSVKGEKLSFRFGRQGDAPLVGDWDGDGRDSVGVRRGRTWLLSDKRERGAADYSFSYGTVADKAVTGDWDGDGRDGVGVYRGRRWLLSDSASAGPAKHDFAYGASGDTPVAGDWNGDGRDDIGVRRSQRWYLRTGLSAGPPRLEFNFGSASDTPVVGDWGKLGSDTVGVRRAATGIWYVADAIAGVPPEGYAPNRFLF